MAFSCFDIWKSCVLGSTSLSIPTRFRFGSASLTRVFTCLNSRSHDTKSNSQVNSIVKSETKMESEKPTTGRQPIWIPIVHVAQVFLSLVVLGLSGYLIHGKYFDTLGYDIFTVCSLILLPVQHVLLHEYMFSQRGHHSNDMMYYFLSPLLLPSHLYRLHTYIYLQT